VSDVFPRLEVRGPDGQQFQVVLTQDRVTIGRLREFNDVALDPDPQQLVTRKAHCSVERDGGLWWVLDNGSLNRTFLEKGGLVEVVHGRALLTGDAIIRVLGRITESGEPRYWQLTFCDPQGTRPATQPQRAAYLVYEWVQARLFRVDGASRQEIRDLRPQEHKLIRYMDQRNRANSDVPVMCTYEELIAAIWGEDASRTESEINHLIWELRKKIEPDPKEPLFLETVRGLGYRLVTHTLKE
jgi:hypothetical protein